jgi:hypothetical protein
MIVLNITAESTADDSWPNDDNNWGKVILKIGRHIVGSVDMTYNEWFDGDEGLERAAARVFEKAFRGTSA